MKKMTIHMLANAHLDPVWLWDWREGMNEGITTCKTMLEMMRDYPEFTFIRGEASIYKHIEDNEPELFEEIRQRFEEGRWDIVGGNWVQSDTNLPATTTFLRQFQEGKRYFKEKFGFDVTAAWAADSFGHSAGLPEIYAASGLKYFAFSRPAEHIVHLDKPAFWWKGQGGSEILCYRVPVGWYGCERHEIRTLLDSMLEQGGKYGLENHGVFFGLGNHGGGSSRRQLDEIREWQKEHPEVTVEFSTLHRFFGVLEKEITAKGHDFIPTHQGELNFCLRGCYSSVAKYKYLYRLAEGAIRSASDTAMAVDGFLARPITDFTTPWRGVLFNTFHDILPGSSIERAFEEQIQWVGGVMHECREKEFAALNALARRIDTTVKPVSGDNPKAVPFVVFNPTPNEYNGHVELEAPLDYRPIWAYVNRVAEVPVELLDANFKPLPFQVVENEHQAMVNFPWRKRLVFPLTIPPFGWRKVSVGYQENPALADLVGAEVCAPEEGVITNGIYRVEAKRGYTKLKISRHGKPVGGADGIDFGVYEDKWGSWGGMNEEPDAFNITKRLETWNITNLRMQESGPERASMWVEFSGEKSRIELTIRLYRDRDAVDFRARVVWNERCTRLKMVMGEGDDVVYEVPGGQVTRTKSGDVPGGRWVKIRKGNDIMALASDAFYCYDNQNGEFGVTLCRGSRYATDVFAGPEEYPDRPAADIGELKCRFVITADHEHVDMQALRLEMPPVVISTAPHSGDLPDAGSILSVFPTAVKLAALEMTEDGKMSMALQNQSDAEVETVVVINGKSVPVGKLSPWRIYRQSFDMK